MQGHQKQRTQKKYLQVKKKEKSVTMATKKKLKANHLQSVQGYGKQRTHKTISPKNSIRDARTPQPMEIFLTP